MALFVPSTPGGELAKKILNIKNLNDQGWNVRFKIVERRGVNSGGKVEAGERCRVVDVGTVSNVRQMKEVIAGERASPILLSVKSGEQNTLERVVETASQGEENN